MFTSTSFIQNSGEFNYKIHWSFKGKPFKKMTGISMFTHPFQDGYSEDPKFQQAPRCLDEKKIVSVSKSIRSKPEWWVKYKNPEISEKWKSELLAQEVRKEIIDYVLAELEFYDALRERTDGKFQIGPLDSICYGDNVVPEELKAEFKKAAFRLEDVPEGKKDWHPNSNNQVLDLVHPSLYPLQYKITPILPEGGNVGLVGQYTGKDKTSPISEFNPDEHTIKSHFMEYGASDRFQWLPSIFDISKDGKVTIESYINNLHPEWHGDLYGPIGKIFEAAIPGINLTLSQYASPQRVRLDPFSNEYGLYDTPEPEWIDDDYDAYEVARQARHPAPVKIKWEGIPDNQVNFDVKGRKLKVITKLANIVLTPENPDYEGGSWHIEGQINEDIVCTAIYYYDSENITSSELGFRVAVSDPPYEQGDDIGIREVYGIEDEDKMGLEVGGIECIEDRVLVFPNIFQHRVSPFSLADKTKPGHRKILCFFVVDPYNDRVTATDRVPPQQSEWWVEKVSEKESNLTRRLPQELFDQVLEQVEWPMSLKKAKEVRLELMEERKSNLNKIDDYEHPFTREFSLCEH